MLQGAYTALITPFRDGSVDVDRLQANVAFQIEQGIDGVVPVGTTGESPTLSHEEHMQVIEAAVQAAAGRIKVIAGTGSNATSEAVALTKHAADVGADAALMVNPYYNKPTQDGLYHHFMTVADAVALPIVLYNIPGRTSITMQPATVARLAEHENIVAIKEATGSMDIASEIATLTNPERFAIVSGDDSLTLPLMSLGGKGVISVLSNLMPAKIKALVDAGLSGDFEQARTLHLELFGLCKGMLTLSTNPIPIKAAMALAGLDTGELRLPLYPLDDASTAKLEKLLSDAGVLPVTA
ncbi:MAG: 4-hydroxy-tetrahydrodipicolinate synthase [Planctomycetes bacterium]|jgi:4-hydroxy-tetrahydrodipicolinate synthase|nr:4-hydroxy-tetrahydrodipicolinate synthase [Planctomycetota bacterium]